MSVPQCLMPYADERRWVLWRYEERNGKQTKPPLQPNGAYASATDSGTWSTLAEVQAAHKRGGFDGIGINMLGLQGVGGIDLDGMRDPETGQPINEAAANAIACGSYVEVSPSGTGYRIFGKTTRTKGSQYKDNGVGFEIYGSEDARYLTITGQQIDDAPDALGEITETIEWLERSADARKQLPAAGNVLPFDLTKLTANGTPLVTVDRSKGFFAVVGKMKDAGLSIDMAEGALRADPYRTGADKYLEPKDRLRVELARVWGKLGSPQVGGSTRGFGLDFIGDVELKPPVYLIEGLVEAGCLGLLFGDPGVGKSFVAIDWALSVASGKDVLGHNVTEGPVVYIAGEGRSGLVRRCHAWAKHHGCNLTDMPFLLSRGPVDLAAALNEVKVTIDARRVVPRMIVVDTVARNFGDGDENSTKDMSAFIVAVDELKAAYPECVVLLVHHSGHSEKQRARGSIALKGALDFEYRLEDKGGPLVLTNTKMKDGAPPDPIVLQLRPVNLGYRVDSAVIVAGTTSQPTGPSLSPQQQIAVDAYIKAALVSGIYGNAGELLSVPTEAWRQAFYATQTNKSADTMKKAFRYSREALVAKGIVEQDGSGYRPDHVRQLQVRTRRGAAA